MATPDIYGQLPPELLADQRSIERQQKIAEAMLAQGMSPLGSGRMVGNTFVAPHVAEGIAKLAQAYLGGKGTRGADQRMADIGSRYNQLYADEVAKLQQMRQGSAPRPQQMGADDMAMIADQGGESAPMMQDVKPASRQAITDAMLASKLPQFQQAGMRQMAQEPTLDLKEQELSLRQSEGAENRAARIQERILALDAAAQNAALTREERAAMAAESAALRRELQQNQLNMTAQLNAGRREDRRREMQMRREDRLREIEQKREDKLAATQGKQDQGKARVTVNLNALNDYYNELEKLGAVVDSSKSGVENISARVRATGVGQALGGALGTEEQVWRGNINQMRPLLLQEIRQASAMGARGLDSNKELEFYLQAATDPTKDIKTNRAAISVLEKAYGLGSAVKGADPADVAALRAEFSKTGGATAQPGAAPTPNPQDAAALEWANANPTDPRAAAIKQRLGAR